MSSMFFFNLLLSSELKRLPTLTVVKALHPLKTFELYSTFPVLKLLRFSTVSLEQPENISLISSNRSVLKLLRLSIISDLQSLNMASIVFTLVVTKLLRLMLSSDIQPLNKTYKQHHRC